MSPFFLRDHRLMAGNPAGSLMSPIAEADEPPRPVRARAERKLLSLWERMPAGQVRVTRHDAARRSTDRSYRKR